MENLQGVLRVDAGMFQCVASSAAGSAAAALRLKVLPPRPDMDLDELRKGNATVVSPPKGLRAVIVKHRFVTLSWEEPENKTEDITGYAVVYKVKGSERERVSRGVAQKHEMNVASLQPNTTYQFAVLAYTEHAASPPTEMIEVTTPEEELTYGPPLNVRAEAVGPHTIKVTWSPPASGQPNKYAVYYTEAETGREQFQWVDIDPTTTPVTSSIGGVRAASAYWIRVAAAGGAPSGEIRIKTPSDAPAAPPGNVTAVSTGATSILVRWEAPPTRTHRGALTGYKSRRHQKRDHLGHPTSNEN
ncbi:fibronectin type III domain-containing protein [Phthorimaea operculella]|nr:fibronectin type III domain-containing protein [Phthorimaea operculella]